MKNSLFLVIISILVCIYCCFFGTMKITIDLNERDYVLGNANRDSMKLDLILKGLKKNK